MAHAETAIEFTPRSMPDWYAWAVGQLRETADDPAERTDQLYGFLCDEEYRAACEEGPHADFDAARTAFVDGYFKLGLDERALEIHGEITDPLAAFESWKVRAAAGDVRPQEAVARGSALAVDCDDPAAAALLWDRLAYYAEQHVPPESSSAIKVYALKARAAARAA